MLAYIISLLPFFQVKFLSLIEIIGQWVLTVLPLHNVSLLFHLLSFIKESRAFFMCIFTTKKMGVTLYWFDELLVFYSSHIVEIVFLYSIWVIVQRWKKCKMGGKIIIQCFCIFAFSCKMIVSSRNFEFFCDEKWMQFELVDILQNTDGDLFFNI